MECFNPLVARYDKYVNIRGNKERKKLYGFRYLRYFSKEELKNIKNDLYEGRVVFLPCGHCLACRRKQKLSWVIRNTFEAEKYENNYFVTLTYDENHAPTFLRKSDLQGFFKRLRINLVRQGYEEQIKYFACGEYGGLHGRPHYHAIIYNLDLQDLVLYKQELGYKVYVSKIIDKSWNLGFSTVSKCTDESIKYTCGYVQKKLFNKFTDKQYEVLQEWLKEHPQEHFQDNFILSSHFIGMEYFKNHKYDLYANDTLLFHSNNRTIETKPVPYFDYLLKKDDIEIFEELKRSRRHFYDYSKYLEDPRSIEEVLKSAELAEFKKYNLKGVLYEKKEK